MSAQPEGSPAPIDEMFVRGCAFRLHGPFEDVEDRIPRSLTGAEFCDLLLGLAIAQAVRHLKARGVTLEQAEATAARALARAFSA